MENLKGITKVRFNDFSDYDSEKCRNGGCYGFWTDYTSLENGTFEVSYGTTADFEYCPVCGSFDDHYEGDDTYLCGEFETITETELLNLINSFVETEDCYITYYREDAGNE